MILTSFETSSSIPSQNTPPSLVEATFVNTVFLKIVFIAMGLLALDVPVNKKKVVVKMTHIQFKEIVEENMKSLKIQIDDL